MLSLSAFWPRLLPLSFAHTLVVPLSLVQRSVWLEQIVVLALVGDPDFSQNQGRQNLSVCVAMILLDDVEENEYEHSSRSLFPPLNFEQ